LTEHQLGVFIYNSVKAFIHSYILLEYRKIATDLSPFDRVVDFRSEKVYSKVMEQKLWRECKDCGYAFDLEDMGSLWKSTDRKWKSWYCKDCFNVRQTKRLVEYFHTPKGKIAIYKANKKSEKKYPEKQRARQLLWWHKKQGNIIKPEVCSFCGTNGRIEGHHKDYSKPLDVIWFCKICHSIADKELVLDKK